MTSMIVNIPEHISVTMVRMKVLNELPGKRQNTMN
jgi:hypothetical protein